MSKVKEMAQIIEELRNAAAALTDAADWLSAHCEGETEPAEDSTTVAPELKDVRAVLSELSRTGHTAEVKGLLQKYGATRLSDVDPAEYRVLLADAEAIDHAD